MIESFVGRYNEQRLHSALGYVTPQCRLEGRHTEIWKQREEKLAAARERRRQTRQARQHVA